MTGTVNLVRELPLETYDHSNQHLFLMSIRFITRICYGVRRVLYSTSDMSLCRTLLYFTLDCWASDSSPWFLWLKHACLTRDRECYGWLSASLFAFLLGFSGQPTKNTIMVASLKNARSPLLFVTIPRVARGPRLASKPRVAPLRRAALQRRERRRRAGHGGGSWGWEPKRVSETRMEGRSGRMRWDEMRDEMRDEMGCKKERGWGEPMGQDGI